MSKTIILNKESLEELSARLESVRMYAETATEYAKSAESVFLDIGTCNALRKTYLKSIDNLIEWLNRICSEWRPTTGDN